MSLMDRVAEQEKQQKAAAGFVPTVAPAVPEADEKSVLGKVGDDASLLVRSGPTILTALTHPVEMFADLFGIQHKDQGKISPGERAGGEMVKDDRPLWRRGLDLATLNIARDISGFAKSGVQFRPKESGIVKSVTDIGNRELAEQHPLLYGLNLVTTAADVATLGAATLVTGPIKKAAFRAVFKEAAEAGIERSAVEAALRSSATRNAMGEAMKKGERGILDEVIGKQIAAAAKVDDDIALRVARRAGDVVNAEMTKKAALINTVRAIEHPFSTAYAKTLGPESITRRTLFGSPQGAAVTKLYGKEAVMKDPDGFLKIEQWAEAQVKERNLENTVENRLDMMREWAEKEPGYGQLTPKGQVKHFQDYADTQAKIRKIHELTGYDLVATRALDQATVDSMLDTVKQNVGASADELLVLLENFGNDFEKNSAAMKKAVAGKTPDEAQEILASVIANLSPKNRVLNTSKFSKEVQELAAEIIGTGYRIGRAPKNKAVSYADEVGLGSNITKADLEVQPNVVGRIIDSLGLSSRGAPQSAEQLIFQRSFGQHIQKLLPARSVVVKGAPADAAALTGKNVRAAKVMAGSVSIPVHKLYDWLERNRHNFGSKTQGAESNIRTVFDIKEHHLRQRGIDDATAKAIATALSKAKTDIPASLVGASEKVLNYVRAKSPSFDRMMTLMTSFRFGFSPTFAAQEFIETTMANTMLTGDLKYFAKQMADAFPRLGNTQRKTLRLTADFDDMVAVQDEILSHMTRTLDDFQFNAALSAEGAGQRAIRGVRDRARRESSMISRNFWYQQAGQSAVRMATHFAESIASKFGMSVKEALEKTKVGDRVVYKNPGLVKIIREATEQGFHYKKGFLTSPLIKTLNVAFYPFRFQAKAMGITAKFVANLPPGARMTFINDLTNTANWLASPEGEEWRTKNHNRVLRLLDYVTAYEGVADTLDAVLEKKPFSGKAGRLGGIPLGFFTDTLRAMSVLPNDESSVNKETGKPYQRYQLKEPLSIDAATTLGLNYLFTAFPSTYANALSGGLSRLNLATTAKHELERIFKVKYEKVR